ncbi:small ribosomal subunit protein mS23-like [Ylistrum balloti]|uniref:small ribosomal subunit protein mS23-like n=1 Tax=Ylistrum balloti TaxID=509963 RepID=UPI002905EF83|nr:small ribosomal subunit protein mS23-like [Ylistrum balloti]
MAASRTEKIRTIFQRCERLMRSGGLPESEKPLWYDVYAAFPPAVEPLYNRPVPTKTINRILYPEDLVRARYYKEIYDTDQVDLKNSAVPTISNKFIDKYFELRKMDQSNPNLFADTVNALRNEGVKLTTWEERENVAKLFRNDDTASRKPDFTAEEVFGEDTVDPKAKQADDIDIDNVAADLFK